MDSRGQVFSLDLLVSAAVVVLAIGLLLNFYELSTHAQKESEINFEMRGIAERAGDLLVANPDITCKLVNSDGTLIMNLPNCLVANDNAKRIGKNELGIGSGSGLNCNLSGALVGESGAGKVLVLAGANGCNDPIDDGADNIIALKRTVVVMSTTGPNKDEIKKQEFLMCSEGSCPAGITMTETDIVLRVWK